MKLWGIIIFEIPKCPMMTDDPNPSDSTRGMGGGGGIQYTNTVAESWPVSRPCKRRRKNVQQTNLKYFLPNVFKSINYTKWVVHIDDI
jgi:hypothetical protein